MCIRDRCDRRSGDELQHLYKKFFDMEIPIIRVNPPTAEMIKYANNAFLATKISFMNTIANICERIFSVDVVEVAKAIGMDPRIGPDFLGAGVGFGGSCLPKDLMVLTSFAKRHGYEETLLEVVLEVNRSQRQRTYELTKKTLGRLNGRRIAILGLAFKSETDDIRDAPSIDLIKRFLKARCKITVYDPQAMGNARKVLSGISYASSALECLEKADCCIVVTDWSEFIGIKPEDFLSRMRTPILIDGRRIYDPKEYSRKLHYVAIGHGKT